MPCDNGGGNAGRNRRPIPRRQLLDLALLLMGCAISDKVFYLSEPSPPSSAKWRARSKVSVVPLSCICGPSLFPSCQCFVEALGRLYCAFSSQCYELGTVLLFTCSVSLVAHSLS